MVDFNKPVSGLVTPRFGGIATFMRMPHVPLEQADGIDIGRGGSPGDGGILQLKDIIVNKPKTTLEFRTQELSPIAYEMLLRSAKLDGASTTATPHASIQKKGVLRVVRKDNNGGDPITNEYFYGLLEVPSKVDLGEDVVRVPFRFTMLTSSLNGSTIET